MGEAGGDLVERRPAQLQHLAVRGRGDGGGAGLAGQDRDLAEEVALLQLAHQHLALLRGVAHEGLDAPFGDDEEAVARVALREDDVPRLEDHQLQAADDGHQLVAGEAAEERAVDERASAGRAARRRRSGGALQRVLDDVEDLDLHFLCGERLLRGGCSRDGRGDRRCGWGKRHGDGRYRRRGELRRDGALLVGRGHPARALGGRDALLRRVHLGAGEVVLGERARRPARRLVAGGGGSLWLEPALPAVLVLDEVGQLLVHGRASGLDLLDLLEERDALGRLALRGQVVRQRQQHRHRLALAAGQHQHVGQLHAQARVGAVALQEVAQGVDGLRVLLARDERVGVTRSAQPFQDHVLSLRPADHNSADRARPLTRPDAEA